ncbi:uncharacterized protein LOC111405078 [Olea europaea var. sylvestris]|uniref:uncharacterized protein LOC111405078 n=1 Tax=Olea europaea var. sylvestris TaxID=158386 RepID=UPI000C1CEB21|nr:uncharacterized protein LOC111405078 [Olea europaea var. sylvestris]
MAISYSFPASIPIRRPAGSTLAMRDHNQISVNTKPLQIRSFSKNKVFEDLSAGIVCYRDENGDVTCEGFDEGPRFHHQLSRFTCNSRDIEIVELLLRCWDAADFKGI